MSVEPWLQFTQYDTVQAMTEDKMEYCRSLMAELILHEIKTHVRKCFKLHKVTINLVPSLAIKDWIDGSFLEVFKEISKLQRYSTFEAAETKPSP